MRSDTRGIRLFPKVLLDSKGVNVKKLSDSAVGRASKLSQAITALKKAEAETEFLQRKGVDEAGLDSVVLARRGSYCERFEILLPAVVDPGDTLVSRLVRRWRSGT